MSRSSVRSRVCGWCLLLWLTAVTTAPGARAQAPLTNIADNHLLLLVQEAITNARKHASPKAISITGKVAARKVSLIVADDSAGFDPTQAPGPKEGHFGLLGMKERLHALGGTLDIQSAPGKGTRVEVSIPLDLPPGKS